MTMAETVGPKPLDNFRKLIQKLNGTPPPDPLPLSRLDEQPSGEEITLPIEEATFRFDDTHFTPDGTGTLGDAVEMGATPAELNVLSDLNLDRQPNISDLRYGSAMSYSPSEPRIDETTLIAGGVLDERIKEITKELLKEAGIGLDSEKNIGRGALIGQEEKDPRKRKKEDVRKIIL
jgi:hypothetical protein